MINAKYSKMGNLKLFNGEKLIAESNSGESQLVLTNLRIQYTSVALGSQYFISIFLLNISTIEKTYKSFIIFIVLGIIFFFGGLINIENYGAIAAIPILIGAALIGLFFYTRYNSITITSNAGVKLSVKTTGMSSQSIHDMINVIENQMRLIYKNTSDKLKDQDNDLPLEEKVANSSADLFK